MPDSQHYWVIMDPNTRGCRTYAHDTHFLESPFFFGIPLFILSAHDTHFLGSPFFGIPLFSWDPLFFWDPPFFGLGSPFFWDPPFLGSPFFGIPLFLGISLFFLNILLILSLEHFALVYVYFANLVVILRTLLLRYAKWFRYA